MTDDTKQAVNVAVINPMTTLHEQAKNWAEQGTQAALGRAPTLAERQFVQAVAFIESGYGTGWKGDGKGSWNMGAVQTRETDPAKSFAYTDTHPNDKGESTAYQARFKKYAGPVEGMADVAHILYRQMGVVPSSIQAVSEQMYAHHYYEGFGATREARIANHVKALTNALTKITESLHEPMPQIGGTGPTPTPKASEPETLPAPAPPTGSGLRGLPFLELLRSAMVHDSSFAHLGAVGRALVADYQVEHGLHVDGVIGPETLGTLIDELDSDRQSSD